MSHRFKSVKEISLPLLVLASGAALFSPSASWAMGKSQPQAEQTQPAPTPDLESKGPSRDVLEQIFHEASAELQTVEAMNAAKNFGPAILAAKKIVDRVSIVHPKGNFSEHLPVNGVLSYPDLKRPFDELRNTQKELIAQAVADSKSGFYLDLLNLWKRAKLAYLKAFYGQMKTQLMEADLRKIREDIFDVYAIAILIGDSKLADTFMLFDSDVANEDQQYFFGRELMEFALSVKELNTNEKALMEQLEESKRARLKKHWDGVTPPNLEKEGLHWTSDWNLGSCTKLMEDSQFTYSEAMWFCQSRDKTFIIKLTNCMNKIYRNSNISQSDAKNHCARNP